MQEKIAQHLAEAQQTLDAFKSDEVNLARVAAGANLLIDAFKNGGKVLACGNGGSMCDAMHFAEELTGRFRDNRKPFPALAIADPSHLTCTANDYGFEEVFARYVAAFAQKGDVLLAISTSGNSANVLRAAQTAKEQQMQVLSLTGKDGGELAALSDVEIRVPHGGYADRIQEIHIKIIHILIDLLEEELA